MYLNRESMQNLKRGPRKIGQHFPLRSTKENGVAKRSRGRAEKMGSVSPFLLLEADGMVTKRFWRLLGL
jgi:hypothetical protein